MELSEVLRRRRSVRRFDSDRPVPAETIDRILDAALRAPSAGHTQGVTLLALDEPDQVASFWRVCAGEPADTDDSWLRGMRTAPLLVTVWTSKAAYLDRYAEPDDQLCVGVVAIGHPAGGGDRGSAVTRSKLSRDVRIRRGSWNVKRPA